MSTGDPGDANTADRGHGLYVTALVLVAGLFVLGRMAARWSKRQFGMDDYTIVAALVGSFPSGPPVAGSMSVVNPVRRP